MDQDCQIYTTQQEKSKKNVAQDCKITILIASQHFSMVLLWMEAITLGFFEVCQLNLPVRTAW
jgi:hypothetical protein